MLFNTMWPKSGMVKDLVSNFVKSVTKPHEVFVVFDQYHEGSIKSHERTRRAGGHVTIDHKLSEDTLLPSRDALMRSTGSNSSIYFVRRKLDKTQ